MDVIAAFGHGFGVQGSTAFPQCEIGAGKVGGTADELRHQRGQRLNGVLRRLACGDRFTLGSNVLQGFGRLGREFGIEFALRAAFEFSGQRRVSLAIGVEQGLPFGLEFCTGFAGVPTVAHVGGYFEFTLGDAQRGACGGDFVFAQRSAVHVVRAGLVRRSLADDCLAANQCRFVVLRFCRPYGAIHRVDVVAVDVADDVPAIGFESSRSIVGEPAVDVAVDGDAVVVVERDDLRELPGAGQRTRFVGNAFHHAAVAHEDVAVVIDDRETLAIELGGQQPFGQSEPHGVADALSERTGGRFDARRMAVFRMSRRLAVQLAEAFEFVERQIVARQMQQSVKQHRAVAIGQHESVTVGPFRIGRIMFEVAVPQGDRDFSHAHRSARMPRIGGLYCIHGQHTNCIGQRSLRNHLLTP